MGVFDILKHVCYYDFKRYILYSQVALCGCRGCTFFAAIITSHNLTSISVDSVESLKSSPTMCATYNLPGIVTGR